MKRQGDTEKVVSWKSEGLTARKLTNATTTDNSLSPAIKWYKNSNFCLIYKGSCLKQNNLPNIIISFTAYELDTGSRDFSLRDCLLGGAKLAKNTDPDKYLYTGYCTGFGSRSEFSLPNGSVGKNVIIFGVDMSSSVHIDNKKKDIFILGKRATEELDDTTLTAEGQYSINFQNQKEKFFKHAL